MVSNPSSFKDDGFIVRFEKKRGETEAPTHYIPMVLAATEAEATEIALSGLESCTGLPREKLRRVEEVERVKRNEPR